MLVRFNDAAARASLMASLRQWQDEENRHAMRAHLLPSYQSIRDGSFPRMLKGRHDAESPSTIGGMSAASEYRACGEG